MTTRAVLKLALPKGRLLEPSLSLLRSIGAAVSEPATTRKLLVPSSDGTLSVLFVKPADVPVYVESGAADVESPAPTSCARRRRTYSSRWRSASAGVAWSWRAPPRSPTRLSPAA